MADIPNNWISRNPLIKTSSPPICEYSSIFSILLRSRGLDTAEKIRAFLEPSTKSLHDPFLIPGMGKGIERFKEAISSKQKILVFADYDADGVISAALVHNFLRVLGIDADIYIPDRIEEGYDLSMGSIRKSAGKTDLIICVDCGTNNLESQEYIRNNKDGPDVIACDHHNPTLKDQPDNNKYIIINPKMPASKYPFKDLSAGGVAFKFIKAALRSLEDSQKKIFNSNYLNSLLDLVAVSTIADIMPLIGENRILAKIGLKKIQETSNAGLKALIDIAIPDGGIIGEYDIGYNIAPRLNAAGRVGNAINSFKLLSNDAADNIMIARNLDSSNNKRREIQRAVIDDIEEKYDFEKIISRDRIFIARSDDWSEGVLGIAASGIVKKYNLPAILFRERNGIMKGSGRSIPGFDLHGNLLQLKDLFIRFGGHKMACGISMDPDNYDEFYLKMTSLAKKKISYSDLIKKYKYDIELGFRDINTRLLDDLELLRPYGEGNPGPVFITVDCKVINKRKLKDGKHIKISLENNGKIIEGLIFNISDTHKKILKNKKIINILYGLQLNVWNNTESIQIMIKDIF